MAHSHSTVKEIGAPSTPEGLYLTYCAACHGTDGGGGSSGRNVVAASAGSIRETIEEEQVVRFLDFLTLEEILAIASYLNGLHVGNPMHDDDDLWYLQDGASGYVLQTPQDNRSGRETSRRWRNRN